MQGFLLPNVLAWVGATALLAGCGDDVAVETLTVTEGEPTTTTSEVTLEPTIGVPTTESPTTSEGGTTTSCGGGLRSCEEPQYPIEGAPFSVVSELYQLDPAEVCATIQVPTDIPEVQVSRPDPLPDAPLPFAILTNGQGQNHLGYGHILNPLAAMGFIAASVQSESEVESRAHAMACVLRWLRTTWVANKCVTPNCDLVLIGHSRGGEAAWTLGNLLEYVPWTDINLVGVDVNLRAVVGLASRFSSAVPYAAEKAVPYLGIMGATDDDVPGQAITAYDSMILEEDRSSNDPGKLLLWPYDVPHSAFGGSAFLSFPVNPGLDQASYFAKGEAIAGIFVPAFIDYFVLGNDLLHKLFTGEEIPDGLTPDLDMDMSPDSTWWSYLEPAFTELGEMPVLLRDFTLDQRANPGIRVLIDDFEEDVLNFDSTLDPEQTLLGDQKSLAFTTHVPGQHVGRVMRVRWGGSLAGGEISWELNGGAGLSLDDFSFLSLRVGQELILGEVEFDACALPPADPRMTALELTVRLRDTMNNVSEVPLGPIVQQHAQAVHRNGTPQVIFCSPSQFMATLRIPMQEFCEAVGFDITSVVSMTIEFPELMRDAGVYLDTLEFTRHPLDDEHLCL